MERTSRRTCLSEIVHLWCFSSTCIRVIVVMGLATLMATTTPVQAQLDDNPVYVDDSPRAWELFRQADDQQRDNPGEAARLYQELLNEYPLKLIPRSPNDPDHFAAVRTRVHSALKRATAVLDRYRLMQTPVAQRLLDQGRLQEVWSSMFLTRPALEATLRLAQNALEDARFNEAVKLLVEAGEHPDLSGRQAAHRWLLLGLSAHHVNDTVLRDEAVHALRTGSDVDSRICHTELIRLVRAGPGPVMEHGINSLSLGPPVALESFVDEPIWTVSLDDSLFTRHFVPADAGQLRLTSAAITARDQGLLLTTLPTVAGRSIFINEGHVIRALDRFSVREFWRTEIGKQALVPARGTNPVGDLNAISMEGDSLVTLTGHATGQSRRGLSYVVCLNKYTGEVKWQVSFDRLNGADEYDELFPHGAPLVFDGTVYVMARRVSRQLLVSSFVVALDLNTTDDAQRVKWVQYVASSAGMQQSDPKPYGSLVMHNGDLFLSTSLGGMARLDATSGEVRWLRRMEVPFRQAGNTRPWDMKAPVVTGSSVIGVDPGGGAVVLDRATGTELARYQGKTWGNPRYLLSGGGFVYAVGMSSLTAIHLDSLDFPLWRLGEGEVGPADFDILGRVQLTDGMLVVPTNRGLLFVDGETGIVERTLPMSVAGNPLAYGPELYVAYSDRLEAYMPLSVAESMLREQIATSPHNPEPSLSLLRLAARSGEAAHACALALEASASAMEVLERLRDTDGYEPAQAELFATLIQIAQRGHEAEFDVASALHGTISAIAIGPVQRVEQLLARGDWLQQLALAGGREHLSGSVEAFQAILSDGELAATNRRSDDVGRTAQVEATTRLARMTRLFGADVYAAQSSDASRRLAMLGKDADPVELMAIARQFPLAPAADSAALWAAEALKSQSRTREALSVLTTRFPGPDGPTAPLLQAIVTLCLQEQWNELGTHWLDVAEFRGGIDRLTIGGFDVEVARLRGRFGETSVPDLPVIGTITNDAKDLQPLAGELVLPSRANQSMQPDHALLIDGRNLYRVDGITLDVAWNTVAVGDRGELLFDDGSRIVVRYPEVLGIVAQYDAQTGEQLWRSEGVEQELPQLRPGLTTRRGSVRLPGREEQSLGRFSSIALMRGDSVIVISRAAGMARYRFDRPPDETVWAVDHGMDIVHHAVVHDLGLVICGEELRSVTGGEEAVGMVAVYDPASGVELARFPTQDDRPVWWTIITPAGQLVYRTKYAIEAFDLAGLAGSWSHIAGSATWAESAWLFGTQLILADSNGSRIGALRLDDGTAQETFQPDPALNWSPQSLEDIHLIGAFAVARYHGRIVVFNPAGEVYGQDAIPPGNLNFTNLVAGAEMLFVISHEPQRSGGRVGRPRQNYVNSIHTLDRSGMIHYKSPLRIETGRDKLRGATGITGWLLLAEQDQTVAIPSVDLPRE